jgi:CopG family transcriptional regulator / antitoxin EndoAI
MLEPLSLLTGDRYSYIMVLSIIIRATVHKTILNLGGAYMADVKRIEAELRSSLIEEVDGVAYMEDGNKNEFIKEAMKLYLRERRRIKTMEAMKNGYLEMSNINRKLSEDGFSQDIRDFLSYETDLAGCGSF